MGMQGMRGNGISKSDTGKSGVSLSDWYNAAEEDDARIFRLDTPDSHVIGSVSTFMDSPMQYANECNICCATLGKRKLNPRHHCRVCKRTVCASCSPSLIQVDDQKELQRACSECVLGMQSAQRIAASIVTRLNCLGQQLHSIANSPADGEVDGVSFCRTVSEDADLDKAVRCSYSLRVFFGLVASSSPWYCEVALAPLIAHHEALLTDSQAHRATLQSEREERATEAEAHAATLSAEREERARETEAHKAALLAEREEQARETQAREMEERQSHAVMTASLELGMQLHALARPDEAARQVSIEPPIFNALDAIRYCAAAHAPLAELCRELTDVRAQVTALEIQLAQDRERSDHEANELKRKLHQAELSLQPRCWQRAPFFLIQLLLVRLGISCWPTPEFWRRLASMWYPRQRYLIRIFQAIAHHMQTHRWTRYRLPRNRLERILRTS